MIWGQLMGHHAFQLVFVRMSMNLLVTLTIALSWLLSKTWALVHGWFSVYICGMSVPAFVARLLTMFYSFGSTRGVLLL